MEDGKWWCRFWVMGVRGAVVGARVRGAVVGARWTGARGGFGASTCDVRAARSGFIFNTEEPRRATVLTAAA